MYELRRRERLLVNPVPQFYARGFGTMPSQGVGNIHPCPARASVSKDAYVQGVLWFGVKAGTLSLRILRGRA